VRAERADPKARAHEAREAVPQARQLVDRAALRRERHGAMLYRSTGPVKRPGTTKRPRGGRTGGAVSRCLWRYAWTPARRRAARAFLRAPVLRCRAPRLTALSIVRTSSRCSVVARASSPAATAASRRRKYVLAVDVYRRFSRRSRSARRMRFFCE